MCILTRIALTAVVSASLVFPQKLRELKPAGSVENIPIEKDIEIGRQAAQEVPKQMAVIQNAQVQPLLDRMIKRLTSQQEAGEFPYSIGLVYDPSINAFAFPGGTMFIHTGLITQADNEAQVAGVLAHEVSHVALRHGMANMVRAQRTQTIAGIGGMLAGIFLGGGAAGQLAQMGIGFGAQSMLLKNSRDAETEADLLGTRMMNGAGYNPIEMARFFEKLEAESGGKGASSFFSDHPNPGNRVKNVSEEIQLLPRVQYNAAQPQQFQAAKTAVGSIKAPAKPKAGSAQGRPGGQIGQGQSGMQRYSGQTFAMDFPKGWEVFGDQSQPDAVTIAPKNAIKRGQNGAQVALGVLITNAPLNGDLRASTEVFLRQTQQTNPGVSVGQSRQMEVSGAQALLTRLSADSSLGGRETIYMLTAQLRDRLFTAAFVAPDNQISQAEPAFQKMIQSIRFSN